MLQPLDVILTNLLKTPCSVTDVSRVGGGCISEAFRVTIDEENKPKRQVFVKRNDASFLDNFDCETLGLQELAEANTIRVPDVLAFGRVGEQAWLVTEWVEPSSRPPDFFDSFGRQLAELHRTTTGSEIGWQRDNYLGAARQVNTAATTWEQFVAEHRLGYQIRWATEQKQADTRLRRDVEAIIDRIADLLQGRVDETSLLHGDLWSGNYLCDLSGHPVLIDPAVYRGCREAEFGMIRLFGSCPPAFDEAYQQTFPLPDGCWRRVSVYVLYHLLNHLNLFGQGYLSQCHAAAAEILRL